MGFLEDWKERNKRIPKKKTPKEVIESTNSKNEFRGIKFTGEELVPVISWSNERAAGRDDQKVYRMVKERGGKEYNDVQTHPYYETPPDDNYLRLFLALPSALDVAQLLGDEKSKIMTIYQRDVETGESMGTTMLFKKPGAGKPYYRGTYKNYKDDYKKNPDNTTVSGTVDKVKEELAKEKMDMRFHPARGYYFNEETGNYEKKKDNLEGKTMIILAGVGILASLFFFSFSLTGNAVSNLNPRDRNILGIVFFLVGLVGLFLHFKRRR
ncbi:MAG: hypothetical protein Q7S06_02795 [Nanoarchaeota archaeon]|nr:hypothetical protein [Nanoarchaeota archaeon]